MIRQRVTRHGDILPLPPASELPACMMEPSQIGVIKPGPVRKWLAAMKSFNQRYAKEKRKVQRQRAKEMQEGGYRIVGGKAARTSTEGGDEAGEQRLGCLEWLGQPAR